MNRLLLAFAAVASVTACSDNRERATPVLEQPDRALQVARPDSSDTVARTLSSRGDQPVSPVEQQVAPPAAKARPAPRKRPAVQPKPLPDTTIRAYAPPPTADTTAALVPDSGSSPQPDTLTGKLPDTTRAAVSDTATPAPDTSMATRVQPGGAPSAAVSGFDDAARTLPIGTEIHAALDDSINSRHDSAGRSITAQISQSVTGTGGKVLIPAGSTVRLTVTRLSAAKSKSSEGRLALSVDGIEIRGQLQKVQADLQPVPRELRGRGVTGGDAAKVGAGAAGGAVLGGVIGGNSKGAVIGGVVGAAGGAVVANQTATRDVVVKAKTPVTFVLTAPLVTP